jgi:hypothetical protein
MAADVNSFLAHRFDSEGVDDGRVCPGAENVKDASSIAAQQAFGHLAAGRISRAEN